MSQDDSFELEWFLPRSKISFDDGDAVTVVESMNGEKRKERTKKIEVKYYTINKKPSFFKGTTTQRSVFTFELNTSIKEAAEYAIENYPTVNCIPDFSEMCVFYRPDTPLSDLTSNVHDMFGPDREMIISNSPQIYQIELRKARLVLVLSVVMLIFFGTIVVLGFILE